MCPPHHHSPSSPEHPPEEDRSSNEHRNGDLHNKGHRRGSYMIRTPFTPIDPRALPQFSPPTPPSLPRRLPMQERLRRIQNYICAFQYNYLDERFFDVRQHARPLNRILTVARTIIDDPYPIRCVEGAFLALYLTQSFPRLDRIPVCFRSVVSHHSYRHVVLAVRHGDRFGSVGLSRKEELYYKPLVFQTLSDLIADFKAAYEKNGHVLASVTVGLPLSHDSTSGEPVCWKLPAYSILRHGWDAVARAIDRTVSQYRRALEEWHAQHRVRSLPSSIIHILPPPPRHPSPFPLSAPLRYR
eukprot:gb/GECH01010283.1/.p1 GENE.gb/GECH01010283.1/~~gb/GECH01010283.1/.p1  ORF type:complete len:299 (+),score=52.23 gb/GECH01010283.1/:1-897(+)